MLDLDIASLKGTSQLVDDSSGDLLSDYAVVGQTLHWKRGQTKEGNDNLYLFLINAGSPSCVFALELSMNPIRRTNGATSSISVNLPRRVGEQYLQWRYTSRESVAPCELDGT